MIDNLRHLDLPRSQPVTPRRTRGGGGQRPKPADPAAHATGLLVGLQATEEAAAQGEAGFDPRLLLKLRVEGIEPEDLEAIGGVQAVSQEGKQVVVLFADQQGLAEFRHRLALVQRGARATREDLLFAVKGVEGWGPEDRVGAALRTEGTPPGEHVVLDVELWPLETRPQRELMFERFEAWCADREIVRLDAVKQESVVMYRLRVRPADLDRLLAHRDVRLVDLPPRYALPAADLKLGLMEIPPVAEPPSDSPGVVVLDSGLASAHPLLGPAVGDAQSFLAGHDAGDECGHGTAVAGLALYGDVFSCMESKTFVPTLRLFSGRITDENAQNDTGFVANHVVEAVEYFSAHYGCRVFNLSFGDARKPYVGGRLPPLAGVVDELSRRHDVLFVVSAGNYLGADEPPVQWRADYPRYLLERDAARILDPAPAMTALTVGSLARFDASRQAQRFEDDVAYQPVARRDQPSPFTRTGPGANGATKPELVEYGGNYGVDLRAAPEAPTVAALLGEPSMAHDFAAAARLFCEQSGTSFAAPKVAHLAARILAEYPGASASLLRALIVAHAEKPEASVPLADGIVRLIGHGRPEPDAAMYSSERRVTLVAEHRIGEDQHHFFEIPLPADFLARGRRSRRITVALAHTPVIRTTRVDPRGSRFAFHVSNEKSVERMQRVFQRTPKKDREQMISEFRKGMPGKTEREKGTVQVAAYDVSQVNARMRDNQLFVVITRTVPKWAKGLNEFEPYALVVVIESREEGEVRYYTQVREMLRARARVRVG
jgi:hypothetical protein